MNCDAYDLAIGDYVDGTLGSDAAALEVHLAGCARCRAMVEDLRAIRMAAGELGAYAPSPQLWGRIAGEIERRAQRPWWAAGAPVPVWQWAAAAVVVLAVAAAAWRAWPQAPQAAEDVSAESAVELPPEPAAPAAEDVTLAVAEAPYAEAIAGLEAITSAAGSELDAETAEVLQASLTVIDDAIDESRAALETEPESELAQQSLFDALRVKVALLQDTLALINEMRKGDQEGAARIVEELNQ